MPLGAVPVVGAVFFVSVNQVLVRLWALPCVAMSDRTFRGRPSDAAMVFRGDCCVLSESDPALRGACPSWPVTRSWSLAAEDGFCAWWMPPDQFRGM